MAVEHSKRVDSAGGVIRQPPDSTSTDGSLEHVLPAEAERTAPLTPLVGTSGGGKVAAARADRLDRIDPNVTDYSVTVPRQIRPPDEYLIVGEGVADVETAVRLERTILAGPARGDRRYHRDDGDGEERCSDHDSTGHLLVWDR
jgi:hypothetical protein